MGSPSSVTAQMVGNTFVTQYYNVLHRMPQIVFRFYTDASSLTRAEVGRTQVAKTQDEIHEVFTSLDYGNCQAEIMTVDSLDSFGGSVFVLVTGAMHRSDCTRKFVQSFILAPQERGYYVLNDIFRYLDEEAQLASTSRDLNGSFGMHDEYEGSQMVSNAVSELSGITPLDNGGDIVVTEALQLPENGTDNERRALEDNVAYLNEILDPRPLEQLSLDSDTCFFPVEEVAAEKKSYAAILQLQSNGNALAQRAVVSHEAASYQSQFLSSHQHNSFPSAHPPAEARQEPLLVENEVDSRSVYVRNLPPNVTDRQLEDEMRSFGPVRPNSVSVRSNKDGGLYAFVDFKDSSFAQAAVEASPVLIGGRKIHIEERKSTYSGGRGRGRGRGQARGMSQNNESKARGTYVTGSSGRGYGNGEAVNQGGGVRSALSVHS